VVGDKRGGVTCCRDARETFCSFFWGPCVQKWNARDAGLSQHTRVALDLNDGDDGAGGECDCACGVPTFAGVVNNGEGLQRHHLGGAELCVIGAVAALPLRAGYHSHSHVNTLRVGGRVVSRQGRKDFLR
jgi:hypothetical protein